MTDKVPTGDLDRLRRLNVEVWQRQHARRERSDPVKWAYPGEHHLVDTGGRGWVAVAILIVLALLAAGWTGRAQAQTVGVNLIALHERGGYQWFTPGVYVLTDAPVAGLNTLGVFRNSLGRTSVQPGRTWRSEPFSVLGVPVHDLALTVGGVTGYPHAKISPLVIPSIRIGKVRAMWLERKPDEPNASRAIAFSVEF